jgi:cytochrome c oxidase assembly factor CtaG
MHALSLVLALSVLLYATGLIRLWRAAGLGRGISRLEASAFFGGWLILLVALSDRMDEWSDQWLAAHMVQHELLMVVAAPLMAASRPLIAWLWLLPTDPRRTLLHAVLVRPITRSWSALTSPLAVFLLHAFMLWTWHLPALYDRALQHEWIHITQHACFFGSAALFWWGVAHGRYGRVAYGAAVIYVFATAIHGGVLGALMTLAPRVWYASYVAPHGTGLTPLEDQQLAGLLMWIPAGVILAAFGLSFFAAWLRESERRTAFTLDRKSRSV